MENKKRLTISIAILLLVSVNIFLFTKQKSGSFISPTISGNAINNINDLIPQEMGLSMMIFIAQWVLIIIIALFAYVRYLKNRKREMKIAKEYENKYHKTSSETDFDLLYKNLKEKEKLSIKAISMIFKISRDQALEWSKILEDNELVTIEYPAFSSPQVLIKKKKDKNKDEKNKRDEKKNEGKESKKDEKKDKEKIKDNRKESKNTNDIIVKEKQVEINIKKRNILVVYLLLIITLGIYGIYWFVSTKNDFNKLGAKVPTAWLLLIPIVNIYWIYKYCEGYSKNVKKDNKPLLWFLITIIVGFVIPGIVQSSLNKNSNKNNIKPIKVEKEKSRFMKKPKSNNEFSKEIKEAFEDENKEIKEPSNQKNLLAKDQFEKKRIENKLVEKSKKESKLNIKEDNTDKKENIQNKNINLVKEDVQSKVKKSNEDNLNKKLLNKVSEDKNRLKKTIEVKQ